MNVFVCIVCVCVCSAVCIRVMCFVWCQMKYECVVRGVRMELCVRVSVCVCVVQTKNAVVSVRDNCVFILAHVSVLGLCVCSNVRTSWKTRKQMP